MSAAAPIIYQFADRMEFSRGERERTDKDALCRIVDGATDVHKTDTKEDRAGVDYVITLRRGAQVYVDAKTRTSGCSRWWRQGPEFALEIWSVMPGGKYDTPTEKSKAGWTLSEQSPVDLILFTFAPQDSKRLFLIPFQPLRMAFRRNLTDWRKAYKVDTQHSESRGLRWQSQAVFVPAVVVMKAVADTMEARS